MHSTIFIYFFILFIISTVSIEQSCIYCQTTACHCSISPDILNCSSYLLNLPVVENCSVWEIVDFSSRNLELFDSNKLLSLRMKHLLLKSNLITYIDDNTFDSIGDILIELDLEMNQILNISSKWLNSNLIYLKILNLASNQIESFSNLDADIQLLNLEILNLSKNLIDSFPNTIHQFSSLVKLDLSFNKLSSIPRYALMGLNNLTWLSLASNRNLTCIIQDSFKYLKSLKYLDLSSTNLVDLDACIFIQLTGLQTLQIERVSLNCTSCWLLIARKNSLQISGQCLANRTIQHFNALTNKQLENTCSKTSIDCSYDYCEPGSIVREQKSSRTVSIAKSSSATQLRTVILILGLITLVILITLIISIIRWKKNQKIFCCHFPPPTSTTIAEATRRRRQHHKQIIDSNPAVIESVVTHGANMNVPSYPHNNYGYLNDETSQNKRKLYNPMFADSPTTDTRQQQQQPLPVMVLNDSTSPSNYLYSEHL